MHSFALLCIRCILSTRCFLTHSHSYAFKRIQMHSLPQMQCNIENVYRLQARSGPASFLRKGSELFVFLKRRNPTTKKRDQEKMFRVLTPASPPPFIVYRLGNLKFSTTDRTHARSLTHSLKLMQRTHSRPPPNPHAHLPPRAGSEAHESSRRTIPLSVVNCSYFRQCSS